MADHGSKDRVVPRDEGRRNQIDEREELRGPQDVPQEFAHDDLPRFEDQMLARQSIALRHLSTDDAVLENQSQSAELADATGAATSGQQTRATKSVSIFRKRIRKFKALKRGYYSFLILT